MSYHEMDGWPIEDADLFGDYAPIRKVECPWSARYTTAATLDGMEYPYRPGCGAFPSRMKIEPISAQTGSSSTTATYEQAAITIWYSRKINTNAAIVETLTPSRDMIPTTTGVLYRSNGDRLDRSHKPQILLAGAKYSHIRMKTAVITPAMLAQVNCVNASASIAPVLDITFAAETLLALMPTVRRVYTMSGITNYFVEQEFLFQSHGGLGWNSIYSAETGAYEYVYDEDGNRVRDYATANFVLA